MAIRTAELPSFSSAKMPPLALKEAMTRQSKVQSKAKLLAAAFLAAKYCEPFLAYFAYLYPVSINAKTEPIMAFDFLKTLTHTKSKCEKTKHETTKPPVLEQSLMGDAVCIRMPCCSRPGRKASSGRNRCQ